MTNVNKKLISTYLNLSTKKADEYLARLGNEIKDEIIKSSDNEEIIGALEVLKEFAYKVPNQTIEIAERLIKNPIPAKVIDNPFGAFTGKEYESVIMKLLELLDYIRYIYPDGVLPILVRLISGDNKEFKNKTKEILKHFAKYDSNALPKIGYGAQRKVLDFILAWAKEDRISNLEFIITASEELLGSSVEGSTMTAEDTLTMHFGAVQPTEFLKNLRREVIDLISNLYKNIPDDRQKIRLVGVLEEAVRIPSNVVSGEALINMIKEDAAYLIKIYREMLFNGDKLNSSVAVAEEIEKRLYWFHKNGSLDTPESKKLRHDILSDPFYSIFRLFVGDDVTFREEEGWDVAEAKRNEAIDAKVDEIDESHIAPWSDDLNRIAAQLGLVDEWQFNHFKIFLRKVTRIKPEVGLILILNALAEDRPLKKFAASFLDGLRDSGRIDLWDNVVDRIINEKDILLLPAIAYSLNIDRDIDLTKEIREEDLEHLEGIVNRSGPYAFLIGTEPKNLTLEHAVLNALTRNFNRDPARVEKLIIETLKNHPEFRNFQIGELYFAIIKGWIDYGLFSLEGIEFLKSWLIDLQDLDWEAQNFLKNLGAKNPKVVFDIFWGRIEKDAIRKSKKSRIYDETRYSPIPYHFNDDLVKFITEQPDFNKYIEKWLEKVTPEWSVYNWNIGQFLREMQSSFDSIIHIVISRGDKMSLAKAVQLMNRFDGGSPELCMEIVSKTDEKKILTHIDTMFYSTGVVSGEDGIARVFEAKAENLKKYLEDNNERIRKYAKRMIGSLEESARRERVRVEEEKQLRKIEFEG